MNPSDSDTRDRNGNRAELHRVPKKNIVLTFVLFSLLFVAAFWLERRFGVFSKIMGTNKHREDTSSVESYDPGYLPSPTR